MKIKRQSTESRINQLLSKEEPSYPMMELEQIELGLALNWYSQHREKEMSHKYLAEYCKAREMKVKNFQIEAQVSTLGFVCRMITRGAILDDKSMEWVEKKLKSMTELTDEAPEPTIKSTTKPVTIQDRLKEKSSNLIGMLDSAIDEFILSDFKKMPNTLELMRNEGITGAHGPNIVNWGKHCRDEYRAAILGKDEQIAEGYSNFTSVQLTKMEALFDQIISDALTLMGEAINQREPRKKKVKTPEQQVKSLKFYAEDAELKIKSVPPTRMIGAEGLWSYHRPSRVLTVYVAEDAAGLGIKGCTVLNYSKRLSRSKKLRKPEEILPQILSSGKIYLRKIMDELTTKDMKISGRLNSETLLVRVIA